MLEAILKRVIRKIPVPYGIFLSGGLDSVLLAALSKPDYAMTCSIKECSELEYAEKVANHLKKLTIDEIHSASSFIAHNLAKEIVYTLAKDEPLCSLIAYRDVNLFSSIQNQIIIAAEAPNPGSMICDALIEDVSPLALQSARLFYT